MKKCCINTAAIEINNTDDLYATFRSELIQAKNIRNLTHWILSIINHMGFSDFLFVRTNRQWQDNELYGILSSIPNNFIQMYNKEQLYRFDQILAYSKMNIQPIFASEIVNYLNKLPFEIELTQKSRRHTQLLQTFGFYDHYVIPIKAQNGDGHVQLCVFSKNINHEEFSSQITPVMAKLRSLCKAIDAVSSAKFRRSFIGQRFDISAISAKQLAIFNALANNDSSIAQTANDLSISAVTAHQHIAGVRKTLGVASNIAAIKKLIQLGLISYS